jgi:hypothetical protein
MRTSLNKIEMIEEFVLGNVEPERRVVFEATLVVDSLLSEEVTLQQETYHVITAYNRAKLKNELEIIHHQLMHDPSKKTFREYILSIFHKQ